MPRDAAATQGRILAAAIDEFAEHGLAGARVDRIAEAAEANKRSIYVYFGSKEGLFSAAMEQVIGDLVAAVPLTEDDLPGYAGRMFDYNLAHPQAMRMSAWRQLERPAFGPDLTPLYAGKLAGMKRAQRGAAASGFSPADLVVLTLGLTVSWFNVPEALLSADGSDPAGKARLARHRAAVVEAARRLMLPKAAVTPT